MKKPIFDGCLFSIAGNLSRSSLDISKAVKENGGQVAYIITKKVKYFSLGCSQFLCTVFQKTTHLLTTDAEVQTQSSKVKAAIGYGALILKESYIWDCINAQSLLDVDQYKIQVVFNS
jgi:BRCT domain, a BRCA1 C-terminus domain